jgi:hypothetical protein
MKKRKREESCEEKLAISPPRMQIPHLGRSSDDFAYWWYWIRYHFRFLKNINVSFWQMYSKPTSKHRLDFFRLLWRSLR